MSFLNDKFYAKNFTLLFTLNSIYILLAQFYNLPKFFDLYWFYSLFFREAMLFCTYFLAFLLLFYLPFQKIVKFFIILASLASVFLLLLNLFLVLNFSLTLNDYLASIALQSDLNEASEFMHSYFSLKFAFFSVLILAFLGFVFKFGAKITQFKKALQIAFFPLFIVLFLIHAFSARPHYERTSDVLYNAVISLDDAISDILAAREEYAKIGANFDKFAAATPHKKAPKNKQIQNIVLIIGESAQRNLHQIYGYYLPNTPNLQILKESGDLLVFSDIISSRGATYESLSQVLTFSNQENAKEPWYRHLNLIDAMRLGGYKSVNISNQEQFSRFSKATTAIFGRADEVQWLSLNSSFESSKPDFIVLDALDKLLAKQDAPTLWIVHLMGQHGVYYNRYPANFAKFKANDIRQKTGAKTIAEYANSVLYTDFVISEILKRFENSDSIAIYFSDHGEDVYDSAPTHLLHSEAKINRFIVEIPFLIYTSPKFREIHGEIYSRIKAAQNKPFMMDDFMHAIIDIAGFEVNGFEENRSLFNAKFNASRKRMVGKDGDKDYDLELKTQERLNLE